MVRSSTHKLTGANIHSELVLAISPTLIFEAIDTYTFQRRPCSTPYRLIGAILGFRDVLEGFFEAVHCFPIVHEEERGEIGITKDFDRFLSAELSLFQNHSKLVSNEISLLGWFSIHTKPQPSNVHNQFYDDCLTGQPVPGSKVFEDNSLWINQFFNQKVHDYFPSLLSASTSSFCLYIEIDDGLLCTDLNTIIEDPISIKAFVSGAPDYHGHLSMLPITSTLKHRDFYESKALFLMANSIDQDTCTIPLHQHAINSCNNIFSDTLSLKIRTLLELVSDESSRQNNFEEHSINKSNTFSILKIFPDQNLYERVCKKITESISNQIQ